MRWRKNKVKMKPRVNRQLTLHERWSIDEEIFKKCGGWIVSSPQCEICKYWIGEDAMHCKKYVSPIEIPHHVCWCKKECFEFKHKNILKIQSKTKDQEQLLGGIFGFCIGDALGVPLEFTTREERKNDPVQEMRAHGTHHQYFGTWSDDTSMTLCLMESLIKGYDLQDISEVFCKFYYESYWTPNNKVFDIGNTTLTSIKRIKAGYNPIECGGYNESDNGNGSLMRILPLAFYLYNKDSNKKIKIIENVSSITHSHKRSKLSCIMYVEFAINLLNLGNKANAYKKMVEFINYYCSNDYESELGNFERILKDDLSLVPEREIRSSGYVVDSLEASIWAFLTTDNYRDAVMKTINLGGDTDTIAALVGGLSGIFYGIDSIPENWIQCLARKDDIYKLAMDFYSTLG